MKGEAEKKSPMFFNFDCGEVEFRGEKAVVKGSLLFDLVHEFRQPNFPAIHEIEVQLKKWLEDHLRGSPEVLEICRPLLKLAAHSLAYLQPEAYTRNQDDQVNMRKGFWMAVMGLIEWFTDELDDEEKYRQDPNFKTMTKFFSSTLYNIFSFQFSNKEELKIHVEDFGLFENYPKFYDLFNLWFDFAQEFYADPRMQECGINREKMVLLGEVFEKEYMSNSWMDGNGLEKVDSFNLYALRRMHSCGGFMQIVMCAIIDGFYEPEFKYIFRDQHVEHFKFLCITVMALVQELLSLKKELKAGDTNNVVLVWLRKGRSLQESVDKAIKKHNQLLGKAQKLYKFLQQEYKNDPMLLRYLEVIIKNFSGICQFMGLYSDRYGNLKWSIDQEETWSMGWEPKGKASIENNLNGAFVSRVL